MRRKNIVRTITRALYAGGTVFFIAGLLLLAVSSPALALQNRAPASAQNALPAAVEPVVVAGVFSGAQAQAKVVYRETIADASQRLIDNLFQGEQPAACPCAGGNADIQNALLQGTPCPCLTITPPAPGTPGTGTSVGFYGGCVCSCDGAYTTVCNAGGDDMLEAIQWQLYNNASGSPSSGRVVASGSIGPLASGECTSLDAAPPLPGNYAYRLVDEDGTVIWSNSCSVGGDCFPGTATATTAPSATVTATSPGTGPTSTATLPGGVTPTAPGVEVTLTSTPTTGGTATATRTPRPPLPVNLSAVCSYVDEDTMLWKVANNTDAAIAFTWQVVGSSETGSGTVDARGSTYFETSAGSKTVQLVVNGEVVDTEASQAPCKQALTVSYTCTENGLVWTISNPNSFEAEYDWSIDGGAQTGSGTLAAGLTVTVATTTTGAHTFTLTWTDDRPGEHVTAASSPADSCPAVTPTATAPGVEITLTSTATSTATNTVPANTATATASFTPTATATAPGVEITLTSTPTPTSTNTQPVVVNTSTNTPTITATAPGVQITLTSTPSPTSTNTQPVVVNTATNTPTLTATAPGVQITLTSTATPTNTQPVVVNTATNTPTVTNTAPVIVNTVTNTPTITSTAPGVQITLTFTPTQTNTLPAPTATFTPTVTLTPPLVIVTVNPAPTLTSAPAEVIGLSSICAYPTDTTLLWAVSNPTAAAASFTWRVVGSAETGTGIVPANNTVYFNTTAGSKVVELLINGQVIATVSSAPPCRLPISVNYVCESPTTINWYVTNGNNITVPYVWAVDNAAFGESQVGPNTNQVFATTGLGQHTVTVTWLIEPLGPRAVQLTANVTTCGGVVTTPTQLVTLAPPAITSTPVIIPQTGGDMAAPALLTSLIGRVFTTIGLLLFGMAFAVTAFTGRWRV